MVRRVSFGCMIPSTSELGLGWRHRLYFWSTLYYLKRIERAIETNGYAAIITPYESMRALWLPIFWHGRYDKYDSRLSLLDTSRAKTQITIPHCWKWWGWKEKVCHSRKTSGQIQNNYNNNRISTDMEHLTSTSTIKKSFQSIEHRKNACPQSCCNPRAPARRW